MRIRSNRTLGEKTRQTIRGDKITTGNGKEVDQRV